MKWLGSNSVNWESETVRGMVCLLLPYTNPTCAIPEWTIFSQRMCCQSCQGCCHQRAIVNCLMKWKTKRNMKHTALSCSFQLNFFIFVIFCLMLVLFEPITLISCRQWQPHWNKSLLTIILTNTDACLWARKVFHKPCTLSLFSLFAKTKYLVFTLYGNVIE